MVAVNCQCKIAGEVGSHSGVEERVSTDAVQCFYRPWDFIILQVVNGHKKVLNVVNKSYCKVLSMGACFGLGGVPGPLEIADHCFSDNCWVCT